MKVSDFIFRYPTGNIRDGICRVRIFVNSNFQIVALITGLGYKNTSSYFIKMVCKELIQQGFVPKDTIFIDHYEQIFSYAYASEFDIVTINSEGICKWIEIDIACVREITNCEVDEFDKPTLQDKRLSNKIEQMRTLIDPYIDMPYQENPSVILRRLEIQKNMISKASVQSLIESNASERELATLLKSDLSILAEVYAHNPNYHYICFSEFRMNIKADNYEKNPQKSIVDFVIFTGQSKMDVILIEVKGADFYLYNSSHYKALSHKMNEAVEQMRGRYEHIFSNLDSFRFYVHDIRENVEAGRKAFNSFIGPYDRRSPRVDRNKNINIYGVLIGGRTRNDLEESEKRYNFEKTFNFPLKLESWDSWIKKVQRE